MKKNVIILLMAMFISMISAKTQGYVYPEQFPSELGMTATEFKNEINKVVVFFLNNKAFIPHNNVEFRFVDSFPGDSTQRGETETNLFKGGRTHIVRLKVIEDNESLIATLVHEYTHCVLNEQVNSPADLPYNTEVICEYVSYCYMNKYYPKTKHFDYLKDDIKNQFTKALVKMIKESPDLVEKMLIF